jgi:hypothetical protein
VSGLEFIVAGYGVILGGLTIYAWTLRRRLASMRDLARHAERQTEPPAAPAPHEAP